MATSPTREALCAWLVFKDEHDGTASPTQRADLLDSGWTDSGLVAFLLDIKNAGFYFEVTSVRRDHPSVDGPNGHNPGGRGVDGWPLNTPTHGDYMPATSPHFADFLEAAAASAWRFQIGLGGSSDTPANLAAIGGQAAVDAGTAFQDNATEHVHLGSRAA